MENLENMINYLNLIDIYRTLYLIKEEYIESFLGDKLESAEVY